MNLPPQFLLMLSLTASPPISQTLPSSLVNVQFPTLGEEVNFTNLPSWKVSYQSPQAEEREQILLRQLEKEQGNYSIYPIDKKLLIQAKTWIQSLSELPFEKSALELIPQNVIKFTFTFPEEVLAMISLPLDQKDEPAVFSLFQNRETLLSNAIPLDQVVQSLNLWLDQG